jgi:hypothetical protein
MINDDICNWKRVGEGITEDDGSITYLYHCSHCGEWKRE